MKIELPEQFQFEESRKLALLLTHVLFQAESLRNFLELALPRVADWYGASRTFLVDYRERTRHFDLIFFSGFPGDARSHLQREMDGMDLERALRQREPYLEEGGRPRLCIPLYLADVLEAVLVMDLERPYASGPAQQERDRLLSRFLGLLFSSARLKINQDIVLGGSELERAREIQGSFLPSRHPQGPFFESWGFNQPSSIVGGDYFDYFQYSEGLQSVLADAAGHGLDAALIMSNFRGLLQAQVRNGTPFADLFNRLNQALHQESHLIQYLTGVFIELGPQGRVRYLNAGHYQPLVFAPDGSVKSLPGGGPPLGMFKAATYEVQEVSLQKDSLLCLFTDGLVDVQRGEEEYFGVEGIVGVVGRNRRKDLPEIAQELFQAALQFGGSGILEDDLTVLLLRLR